VIDDARNMPLATARKLEEFAKGGGILVSVGENPVPTHVAGYKSTDADQKELHDIMERLFTAPGAPGIVASTEPKFAELLGKKLAPDALIEPATPAVGVIHRHGDGGEIYFVANTGATKANVKITFRQAGKQAETWDPLTTKVTPLAITARTDATSTVALDLPALGSTIVVFTNRQLPAPPASPTVAAVDLSTDWNVSFASGPGGSGKDVTMQKLVSWTELPGMANYSGVATYQKKFTASADIAAAPMVISFGQPAAAGGGGRGNGYVAPLNSPIRDCAVVFINDKRAGAAWAPPFTVDVSGFIKEGDNSIRIEVGNTAVNYLAKAGFPNYNLAALRQVYGNRFDPQNTNLVSQPLPSGLLGPIKLEQQH
jgi:hypothetical protein